jgi:hypothetical protein
VLCAVQSAGGLGAPLEALSQAIRSHLHDSLPGPWSGRVVVDVPKPLEAALLVSSQPPGTSTQARQELDRWLREAIAAHGPAVTLVTESDEGRRLLGVLGHAQHPLVAAMTRSELSQPEQAEEGSR